MLDQLGGVNYGRYFVAGTAKVVADAIEKWLDEDGVDGINLVQYHSYETARDFIEYVVPELRSRGRFRESYNDGETLRQRLFGPDRARLPDYHYGARYRDPARLQDQFQPLPIPPKPAEAGALSMHEQRESAAPAAAAAAAVKPTASRQPAPAYTNGKHLTTTAP